MQMIWIMDIGYSFINLSHSYFIGVVTSASESTRLLIESVVGQQPLFLLESSATYNKDADDKDSAMRHVKQRTEDWFALREDGALSSSDLANGLGFFTVTKARLLQEKMWLKVCFSLT